MPIQEIKQSCNKDVNDPKADDSKEKDALIDQELNKLNVHMTRLLRMTLKGTIEDKSAFNLSLAVCEASYGLLLQLNGNLGRNVLTLLRYCWIIFANASQMETDKFVTSVVRPFFVDMQFNKFNNNANHMILAGLLDLSYRGHNHSKALQKILMDKNLA